MYSVYIRSSIHNERTMTSIQARMLAAVSFVPGNCSTLFTRKHEESKISQSLSTSYPVVLKSTTVEIIMGIINGCSILLSILQPNIVCKKLGYQDRTCSSKTRSRGASRSLFALTSSHSPRPATAFSSLATNLVFIEYRPGNPEAASYIDKTMRDRDSIQCQR
jgi:hypothetical protein